eukprot:COSAG01_NODE_16652_length_1217_cov_1.795170_2_plen_187_part_00
MAMGVMMGVMMMARGWLARLVVPRPRGGTRRVVADLVVLVARTLARRGRYKLSRVVGRSQSFGEISVRGAPPPQHREHRRGDRPCMHLAERRQQVPNGLGGTHRQRVVRRLEHGAVALLARQRRRLRDVPSTPGRPRLERQPVARAVAPSPRSPGSQVGMQVGRQAGIARMNYRPPRADTAARSRA